MKNFIDFLDEANAEMKSGILKAYSDCDKNKKTFIKLVNNRLGLTLSGLKRTGYLDTLIFK